MDAVHGLRLQRMAPTQRIEGADAPAMMRQLLITVFCAGIAHSQIGAAVEHRSMPDRGAQQLGFQLFSSNCAGCHGLDGHGGEHGPNIATRTEVQELNDPDILRVVRQGIPHAGMPAFGVTLNSEQLHAVVAYLRILQGKGGSAAVPGDPQKGRALFFGKARCSECHMIAGRGGFIAADLSAYGNQRSPDSARRAILNPNENLDPRQRTVTVVARDGRKYSGLALNEDNFSLQLQTLDGTFHLFDKATLARIDHEPRSIMPANYGSLLTNSELDDLVSYLLTARVAQAARVDEGEEQ